MRTTSTTPAASTATNFFPYGAVEVSMLLLGAASSSLCPVMPLLMLMPMGAESFSVAVSRRGIIGGFSGNAISTTGRLNHHNGDGDSGDSLLPASETRRDVLGEASVGAAAAMFAAPLLVRPVPAFAAAGSGSKELKEEYRQGTAALADTDDAAPVPKEAYKKLPSGVIYADLRQGNGPATVGEGSRVNLQWVLRKSNGYFVDSSEKGGNGVPFIFTVGKQGEAIQGVDEGVRGMKVGGVRRLLVPPSLAYVDGLEDGKPGPLPNGFGPRQQMRRVQSIRKDVPGEYVYLEVQVTRVK